MIRLTKLPKPQVLIDNAALWSTTLLTKLKTGEQITATEKTRYRHRDIKATLELETHGKCAYCESKLKHIHHGDVEHIFPKSLDPSLQFEWENLTLSCEICNQNKSNLDPDLNYIIDPYKIDPIEHLTFIGPIAYPLGTPEGLNSIKILDLNRPELAEMRQEAIAKIMMIFDTLLRNDISIPARRAILQDLELNEASDKVQFAAVAKSLIDQMKTKLPPEIFS